MRLSRFTKIPSNGYLQVGPALALEFGARQIILNGATLTQDNIRGGIWYQDASGGSVTMVMPTGAQLAAMFPDWPISTGMLIGAASNHATNTSTVTVGSGVTLVGVATTTQIGSTFALMRTGAATWELVRCG